jgi:dodecin
MVEKTITLTGTSTNSIEDAVGLAVTRAAQTIDGIRKAEVAGITAMIEDGTINAWRVRIRLSFGVQERIHE